MGVTGEWKTKEVKSQACWWPILRVSVTWLCGRKGSDWFLDQFSIPWADRDKQHHEQCPVSVRLQSTLSSLLSKQTAATLSVLKKRWWMLKWEINRKIHKSFAKPKRILLSLSCNNMGFPYFLTLANMKTMGKFSITHLNL